MSQEKAPMPPKSDDDSFEFEIENVDAEQTEEDDPHISKEETENLLKSFNTIFEDNE